MRTYSFALTAHEMCTGKIPWRDARPAQIAMRVAVERARGRTPRRSARRHAALIAQCWAHEPRARPSFEHIRRVVREAREAREKREEAREKKEARKEGGGRREGSEAREEKEAREGGGAREKEGATAGCAADLQLASTLNVTHDLELSSESDEHSPVNVRANAEAGSAR